ncbi:MAG TPA: DUF3243 domain-containing protein [Symbiobacteriaceae bacterium]|nr:DUF3243 domain-containing protein [Symbiobacteriaceae bacterium]
MTDQMDTNPANYNVSDDTLRDYDQWKQFLSSKVQMAKNMGMSEQAIANSASRVGDFLSSRVDPKNNQQRVLKELWDSGSEQEQQTLASMIVKMVGGNQVQ